MILFGADDCPEKKASISDNDYQFQKGRAMKKNPSQFSIALGLSLLLAACAGPSTPDGGRLRVLATTSIVGDVVRQVGGEYVDLGVLLPLGTDPHTFEPRPRDAAAIAEAEVVFANGAGLEEFLHSLIESAGAQDRLVEVSEGISQLPLEEEAGEGHAGEDEHAAGDPHTWMDPNNVLVWVENIAAALASADPVHAAEYRANAQAYAASLRDLDAWIRTEVARIPPDRRLLVSDHAVFGYFARAYGFTQIGTITGSFSTNASPSAQELAALEDSIRSFGVPAVFVGESANRALADQVAADTGIQVVIVYHASLSDPDGPAPDYLEYMRYNVSAIVEALK
jgi:ABC-type Zn uptake system ZnuABC Zn-binding protein ZnuA